MIAFLVVLLIAVILIYAVNLVMGQLELPDAARKLALLFVLGWFDVLPGVWR